MRNWNKEQAKCTPDIDPSLHFPQDLPLRSIFIQALLYMVCTDFHRWQRRGMQNSCPALKWINQDQGNSGDDKTIINILGQIVAAEGSGPAQSHPYAGWCLAPTDKWVAGEGQGHLQQP